jgi:hypothetical protein
MRRIVLFCLTALIVALPSTAAAQNQRANTAKIVTLLESSTESYKKVSDGVWSVMYKGSHTKSIEVRVGLVDDLVVFLSVLGDKSDFKLSGDLYDRFLQFNNDVDSCKLTFAGEQIQVRLDLHVRLLDEQEWGYAMNQVASAIDEAVGKFKKDLK